MCSGGIVGTCIGDGVIGWNGNESYIAIKLPVYSGRVVCMTCKDMLSKRKSIGNGIMMNKTPYKLDIIVVN